MRRPARSVDPRGHGVRLWLPRVSRAPLGAAHCGAPDVRRPGHGIRDPIESSSPQGGTPRSERGSESSASRHLESCDRGHLSAGDFLRERRSRKSGQRGTPCVCPYFFPRDFCKWWREMQSSCRRSKAMRRTRCGVAPQLCKVATNSAHGVRSDSEACACGPREISPKNESNPDAGTIG